jgi:hypothetical protein
MSSSGGRQGPSSAAGVGKPMEEFWYKFTELSITLKSNADLQIDLLEPALYYGRRFFQKNIEVVQKIAKVRPFDID